MSDRQSAPDPDALEFIQAQLRYWGAWLAMASKRLSAEDNAVSERRPTAWSDALKRWWGAVAPAGSSADDINLGQLIPRGQAYLLFGEQALRIIASLEEAAQRGQDWRSGIENGIDRIRASYFSPFEGPDQAQPPLAALWGLPLSSWQQVATCGPMAFLDANPLASASISSIAGQTLETEWQQRARRGARLWQRYQDAHREYAKLVHGAADRSLDRLQVRLIERGETRQPITTLRDLYNLWVDCAEEAYSELIRGEEYSQAQGRMINSLMRARRHDQSMYGDILKALRIPNRAERDAIHARLLETRRRLGQLESASPNAAQSDRASCLFVELQAELEALRRELGTVKGKIQRAANSGESSG